MNITIAVSHNRFVTVFEDHSFTFATSFFHGQVVVTQNHVLRWSNYRFPIFRVQDVLSS
ncbi:Uncharacterised protein [Mycobacterium tuberculosis]|nr:Uncharacterised protein [Mycobacterium tuberculosis]